MTVALAFSRAYSFAKESVLLRAWIATSGQFGDDLLDSSQKTITLGHHLSVRYLAMQPLPPGLGAEAIAANRKLTADMHSDPSGYGNGRAVEKLSVLKVPRILHCRARRNRLDTSSPHQRSLALPEMRFVTAAVFASAAFGGVDAIFMETDVLAAAGLAKLGLDVAINGYPNAGKCTLENVSVRREWCVTHIVLKALLI